MVLEPLADGVWVARAPFRFLTFAIGTRMSVVRLPDGGLLLHSPIAPDSALRAELDALGPVRHIVCPNLFHHVFAGPMLEAYPEARLYAPAQLRKKRPELRVDRDFVEGPCSEWGGALEGVRVQGSMLDETVLFHGATGTLISADFLEYFERCDEAWTRGYLKLAGVYQRVTWNRLLRLVYRDRKAARASIDRILEFPIERVVIAHGDVITKHARAAVREGFAWL